VGQGEKGGIGSVFAISSQVLFFSLDRGGLLTRWGHLSPLNLIQKKVKKSTIFT
jgi:hypothetical protein